MEEGECEEVPNITPKLEQQPSTSGVSGGASSPGRSSPDPACAICLGKLDNKSFTDSCFHQFCFSCLREWSKVKAECPLCKQKFKKIIHNVKDLADYEEYLIQPSERAQSPNFRMPHPWQDTFGARPSFRYRTTSVPGVSHYLDYVLRLEEAMNQGHVLPTLPAPRRRQSGTSDFRRSIYQRGLWVQRMPEMRVRESSPEFYRENPATVHRLVPWLNRELNVLCSHQSQTVLDRILVLITQVPIRSRAFAAAVQPYLCRHTDHFVHEFHSFATTFYDMVGYDRHTSYGPRDALAHLALSATDSDDSDVQVLDYPSQSDAPAPPRSPHSIHLGSDSDDCVVVDGIVPRQSTPEVITIESDEEVVQVNIHINSEASRPGPSRRPPLKRRWLHSSDTQPQQVNVSININRAGPSHGRHVRDLSTTSSSSSSSSSFPSSCSERSPRPQTKRKKRTKRCSKKSSDKGKKARVKGRFKSKLRVLETSSEDGDSQPAPKTPPPQPPPDSDEDSYVLRIDTDVQLSTDTDSDVDGGKLGCSSASTSWRGWSTTDNRSSQEKIKHFENRLVASTPACEKVVPGELLLSEVIQVNATEKVLMAKKQMLEASDSEVVCGRAEFSSASEEEDYKRSLRSVVVKSEPAQEQPLNLSRDLDSGDSSDSGYRGPSRSARRYSSASSSKHHRAEPLASSSKHHHAEPSASSSKHHRAEPSASSSKHHHAEPSASSNKHHRAEP